MRRYRVFLIMSKLPLSGRNSVRAYLGLGGNLGDPQLSMAKALRRIDTDEETSVLAVSPLYRTSPWGKLDQPDFLNACAEVTTSRSPQRLLTLCLETERELKRVRGERWGPRVIDIDILLFGDRDVSEVGLQIPHPQIAKRAFVLIPLAALAPDIKIRQVPISTLLCNLSDDGICKVTPDGAWWRKSGSD